MDDWDDGIDSNQELQSGRSFGKGRGFVPVVDDSADTSWKSNDNRKDFGDRRGRGGNPRGGRGGRGGGGRFNNSSNDGGDWYNKRDNDSWNNNNNNEDDSFSRQSNFEGGDRRGRGRGRGRGGSGRGGGRDYNDLVSDNKSDNGEEGNGEERPKERYIPPELSEDQIFEDGITRGINFDQYDEIPVKVTGSNIPKHINSFREAGLRDLLLKNLSRCHYDKPTPIQKYAITTIMEGRDLMATAQTGSGKTAAFLLPIIHSLLSDTEYDSGGSTCQPSALVVTPTRELTIQIYEVARKFTSSSHLKVCRVYGGAASFHQSGQLSKGCHILIATPGRLKDFVNRNFISFGMMKYVVLDEADRMLDMGFREDIETIMNHPSMPPADKRQTLMFSATFSEEIQRLAAKYLRDYIFVAVGIVGGANKDIQQEFIAVPGREKKTAVTNLLKEQDNVDGTLLFVETKRTADFLASFLSGLGFKTTSIHGDRLQSQREEALADFKSRRMSILVATSVAARGLDIKGVTHVINYDLPKEIDEYVHRIGRTGRLGNKGKATSFYDSSGDNRNLATDLVKILQEANMPVPDFLKQDAGGAGQYESTEFGGYDYRKNDEGFITDPYNQPQQVQAEDSW